MGLTEGFFLRHVKFNGRKRGLPFFAGRLSPFRPADGHLFAFLDHLFSLSLLVRAHLCQTAWLSREIFINPGGCFLPVLDCSDRHPRPCDCIASGKYPGKSCLKCGEVTFQPAPLFSSSPGSSLTKFTSGALTCAVMCCSFTIIFTIPLLYPTNLLFIFLHLHFSGRKGGQRHYILPPRLYCIIEICNGFIPDYIPLSVSLYMPVPSRSHHLLPFRLASSHLPFTPELAPEPFTPPFQGFFLSYTPAR